MAKQPYQSLLVWQKAMDLVDLVYGLTTEFPKTELFGLTSQSRRSAVSVPSNIAEGSQRGTDRDFGNFLLIAKGSLAELNTQLLIAYRREYIDQKQSENVSNAIEELNKMLFSLHRKILPQS